MLSAFPRADRQNSLEPDLSAYKETTTGYGLTVACIMAPQYLKVHRRTGEKRPRLPNSSPVLKKEV